tara:strand:- start:5059 stop:6081 length:1023 start_codon:yes stop_codon:yes gene_type:complete
MTTKMVSEIFESAQVLTNQWSKNQSLRKEISSQWKSFSPYSFLTVARGSSDHAAQYFNYLCSLKLGKLTTSFTPSLITQYQASIDCSKSVAVAISQSGRSPDLIAPFESFNKSDCHTLALVNVEDSPLAKSAKSVYPLHAQTEHSVAATKSFIASLFASASLIAQTAEDKILLSSLEHHADTMEKTTSTGWDKIVNVLEKSTRAMIVGRGLGFPIALEAALKLKETCHIQAEAFSSAEILHGPQAVIEANYPLIIFALRGPCQKGLLELGKQMRQRAADVIVISDQSSEHVDCVYKTAKHEDLDPINAIHHFYMAVEKLAKQRGLDPDNPRSLAKVTLTL